MRLVLDTNVVVSRFLSPLGPPARVVEHWSAETFVLLVSEPILAEYRRALLYERVRARHGMSEQQVAEVIAGFRQFATLVVPQVALQVIRDDPADDKFLECAVTGGADYIVSGDTHLLRLGEYAGIQILSPAGFLMLLQHDALGEAPG